MDFVINENFKVKYNEIKTKTEAAKTKKYVKQKNKRSQNEDGLSCSDSSTCDEYKDDLARTLLEVTGKIYKNKNKDIKKTEIINSLNTNLCEDEETDINTLDPNLSEDEESDIDCESLENESVMNVSLLSEDDDSINKSEYMLPTNTPKKSNDIQLVTNEDETINIHINQDRNIATVRQQKSNTRSQKKHAREERKQNEFNEKVKKLKELHDEELKQKYEKLCKTNPEFRNLLKPEDLDEDFNPDNYDKLMDKLLAKEEDADVDEEKPIFSEDEIDDEELMVIDDDELPMSSRKRKRKLKKIKKVQQESKLVKSKANSFFTNFDNVEIDQKKKKKPGIFKKTSEIFDEKKHKSLLKFYNETREVLFEDIITGMDGEDLLCKFSYLQTEPQNFGLTMEEMFLADDKELKAIANMKMVTRITTNEEENRINRKYNSNKQLNKKTKILQSVYGTEEELNDDVNISDDTQNIKEINNKELLSINEEIDSNQNDMKSEQKKVKKSKKKHTLKEEVTDINIARMKKSKKDTKNSETNDNIEVKETNDNIEVKETNDNVEVKETNMNKDKSKKKEKQQLMSVNEEKQTIQNNEESKSKKTKQSKRKRNSTEVTDTNAPPMKKAKKKQNTANILPEFSNRFKEMCESKYYYDTKIRKETK